MSGSHRYLNALESLLTLWSTYPTQAEMSLIQIIMDPAGQAVIVAHLHDTEPAAVAAGLVDWDRTLARTNIWAYRTPKGYELHFAIVGDGDECPDVPIVVIAGPIPYSHHLDYDIDPGTTQQLSAETIRGWAAVELVHTWPFKHATFDHQTAATTQTQP